MGLAILMSFSVNFAQARELSKADVEKIIKEYISANGGELATAIEDYLAKEQVRLAEESIKEHSPIMGKGKVTFIEYSDYRCGYCRRVQDTLSMLREEYEGRVKFAFKYLPILTELSRETARAAQAAHRQGKFWEFHKVMWENQDKLSDKFFIETAEKLKLNINKFNADRKSATINNEIDQDVEDARELGVQGTPFFVIDGQTLSGAQPVELFRAVIDKALARQED